MTQSKLSLPKAHLLFHLSVVHGTPVRFALQQTTTAFWRSVFEMTGQATIVCHQETQQRDRQSCRYRFSGAKQRPVVYADCKVSTSTV